MNNITIVLPNKNNKNYLKDSINSIVGQVDKNFRFIVSDNHSDDISNEIINLYKDSIDEIITTPYPMSYKEHILWLLDYVNTEYVIFFAGDDVAHHDLINEYNRIILNNKIKPINFICSPFYYIDKNSIQYSNSRLKKELKILNNDINYNFLRGPLCNISSVAWSVKELRKVFIPEYIENSLDWYLYIVMSKKGKVLYLPKRLLFYRVHNASTGNSNVVEHTKNCILLFKYLKNEVYMSDAYAIKIINRNLNNFQLVISNSMEYKIKNIILKIVKIFI
jgi:glycosyltransferase involved in cell wall biosynthesis